MHTTTLRHLAGRVNHAPSIRVIFERANAISFRCKTNCTIFKLYYIFAVGHINWFWEKRTKPTARRYEQTSYEKLDFRNIDNHINFAGVITFGYQLLLRKMFNLFNLKHLINPFLTLELISKKSLVSLFICSDKNRTDCILRSNILLSYTNTL